MEQSRLRVGGWVEHQPGASYGPATEPVVLPEFSSIEDGADASAPTELLGWDRVLDDGVTEDDTYRGRRRQREPRVIGLRRLALVAVAVGALLLGIGAVSQLWRSGPPDAAPAPPPVPEHTRAAPTEGTANLGLGPTGGTTAAPGGGPAGGTTPPSADPAPPPPPVADLEAEAANRGGTAMVRSLDGASGGQVVRLAGVGYVEFTGIQVDQPGRHRLVILYAADDDRRVEVSVNDDSTDLTLTASGGAVTTASVQVDLTGGANTVRISLAGGGPPVSIDGLVLD
jgi:hypothetical protein